MSHSRKESNEFKFKQAENKLNINNYPTLRDLINQKKSPKNENQLCRSTFNFEFVIGIGGFGKVWKVEHKKNN